MTFSLSAASVVAITVSFILCVLFCAFLMRPAERVMTRRKITVVEYPAWRKRAKDVPPVGGIAVIASSAFGFLIAATVGGGIGSEYVFLLAVAVLFAAVGFADDMLTLTQNVRFRLPRFVPVVLRAVLAVGFAFYSYNYNGGGYVSFFLFLDGTDLGVLYIPLSAVVILFFSFSARITNGSDGLNAATCVPVFAYLSLFALGRQGVGDANGAFLSFSLLGAVLGFLIFGKNPARIFEGHSGTSFCGTCAVLLCFLMKCPSVIFIIGFVWLVQEMSFLLSRAVYFFTRGKHRLLPVAPLDSFLRSVGVSENAVVFSYFATGVVFAAVAYILTGGL